MHVQIDWDWLLHADELLFFLWLVVWIVEFVAGLIGGLASRQRPKP